MTCGGGTQSEFCKACGDQNRSTITCARCGVCFVWCKIVFHSILDQNAPIHEKMKRKYAEKYSTAQKSVSMHQNERLWSVWRCSHTTICSCRPGKKAAEGNYILESLIEWTLYLVKAKEGLLRLLSYLAFWIKFEANVLFDFIMTWFLGIML